MFSKEFSKVCFYLDVDCYALNHRSEQKYWFPWHILQKRYREVSEMKEEFCINFNCFAQWSEWSEGWKWEEKKRKSFHFIYDDEEKFRKMEMRMMKFNSVKVWLALVYFSSEGLVVFYRSFYLLIYRIFHHTKFHQFNYLYKNILILRSSKSYDS